MAVERPLDYLVLEDIKIQEDDGKVIEAGIVNALRPAKYVYGDGNSCRFCYGKIINLSFKEHTCYTRHKPLALRPELINTFSLVQFQIVYVSITMPVVAQTLRLTKQTPALRILTS